MKMIAITVGGIGTNCYIVSGEDTGKAAVIDPGDEAERILSLLKEHGLTLTHILLTHGHFDHILAVPELKAATGAPVVVQEDDAPCLTDPRLSLGSPLRVRTAVPADIRAADKSEFASGTLRFVYLHTPGHTRGSCVILCENAMFSGDTLFKGGCGRCDFPGGDYGMMLRSLKRLRDLPGDYRVYPGHGPSTTLEEERINNAYMIEASRP